MNREESANLVREMTSRVREVQRQFNALQTSRSDDKYKHIMLQGIPFLLEEAGSEEPLRRWRIDEAGCRKIRRRGSERSTKEMLQEGKEERGSKNSNYLTFLTRL